MSANQNVGGTIIQDMVANQNVGGTLVEMTEGWQNINGTLIQVYETPNAGWWSKNKFKESLFNSSLFSSENGTKLTEIVCRIDGNKMYLKLVATAGESHTKTTTGSAYSPYATITTTYYDFNWKFEWLPLVKYPGVCITTAADNSVPSPPKVYPWYLNNPFWQATEIANSSDLATKDGSGSSSVAYGSFKGWGIDIDANDTSLSYTPRGGIRLGGDESRTGSSTAVLCEGTFEVVEAHFLNRSSKVVTKPLTKNSCSVSGTGSASVTDTFTINKTLRCFLTASPSSWRYPKGTGVVKIVDSSGNTVCNITQTFTTLSGGEFAGKSVTLPPGTYTVTISLNITYQSSSPSDSSDSTSWTLLFGDFNTGSSVETGFGYVIE